MQAGRSLASPSAGSVRPPHPCQNPTMLGNRSMRSCTVIPELDYDDMVEALDWLCAVFGFTERWRAEGHRGQLPVGDGAVVVEQRQSGERQYTAVDLGGHVWTFSQSIADVAPEGWGGVSASPDRAPAGRARRR